VTAHEISKATAPRTWTAMLDAWFELVVSLAGISQRVPFDPVASAMLALPIRTWRWMWIFPPCSDAREAAFALGHAAMRIERWRTCITEVPFRPDDGFPICVGYMVGPDDGKTGLRPKEEHARALPEAQVIGQAAEAALILAAKLVDDARGEAHWRTRGIEPAISPHERIYERDTNGIRIHGDACAREDMPRIILGDHALSRFADGQRIRYVTDCVALEKSFAETAIKSLPDGPWTMTSSDVARFLDMILGSSMLCLLRSATGAEEKP